MDEQADRVTACLALIYRDDGHEPHLSDVIRLAGMMQHSFAAFPHIHQKGTDVELTYVWRKSVSKRRRIVSCESSRTTGLVQEEKKKMTETCWRSMMVRSRY